MKGAPGIVVALFLGLLGAVLNWVYLDSKTKDVDSISFLGVREGASIQVGEPFRQRHFVEVRIPARHARNLKDFVYLYKDEATIVGTRATHAFQGGELIHREDYVTPSSNLALKKDELLFWISVDPRSIVPELIVPGDRIKFLFPNVNRTVTRAAADVGIEPDAALPRAIEDLGPFTVKTLGNRLGRVEVMRANRQSPAQEQKIGIVIDQSDPEEVARFDKLTERVLTSDYRTISVILLSRS
ncbi:MAG: hypothetical protein QF918_11560 [Pirellulaceae bacterium]|jgi:hypothetical protein|nr:hypothetical protein [Planctomycetaceae bacterium]MDP6468370.1 hypothetical protein [Pirellulaceae bacterium]MDP6554976.1 hypothetical protein [Pirellulaceae bacterium]MDP6718631.1 hypothetical protein [Pirellulaceae bacterium]